MHDAFLPVLQVIGEQVVTRGLFHKKVTTFVNLLKARGAKKKHRVLMTVTPSVDFYALAVAVFAIGEWDCLYSNPLGLYGHVRLTELDMRMRVIFEPIVTVINFEC